MIRFLKYLGHKCKDLKIKLQLILKILGLIGENPLIKKKESETEKPNIKPKHV